MVIKEFIAKHNSNAWVLFYFGVITFVYMLCASSFIQIYVIQVLFPQFNLGDGLAVFDSAGFDQIAKSKAIEINEKGWGAWELRPRGNTGNAGQSPSGIASFFYTLWAPKPYVMLPFNAFVHALSGCLVVWLLRIFYSWVPSLLGGALFVLNPAAMEWAAQIHRDGIFILGNLMVLASLFHLFKILETGKISNMIWSMFLGMFGTSLVWVARPYWIQVLITSIILCMISVRFLYAVKGKDRNEK
ncbi:MAG: hypothetical protein HND53_01265 [Proteobacteria bacterium]|nr:hypothetical protein [Pseudomonadota bacterium]NOG59102.1 hypothetical protein [Pseudomonadota bacterium]